MRKSKKQNIRRENDCLMMKEITQRIRMYLIIITLGYA